MRSRGLVVAIAVVLAVLAAVGVIVYTSNVRDTAVNEGTEQRVTSSQDIPANTPLDPLIASNVFKLTAIPPMPSCPTAVTDISQLQGQVTTAPIYQNEQIPLNRLSGGTGATLGITPGNIGLGLEVERRGRREWLRSAREPRRPVRHLHARELRLQAKPEVLPDRWPDRAAAERCFELESQPDPDADGLHLHAGAFRQVLAVSSPPVDTSTGKPTVGTSTSC